MTSGAHVFQFLLPAIMKFPLTLIYECGTKYWVTLHIEHCKSSIAVPQPIYLCLQKKKEIRLVDSTISCIPTVLLSGSLVFFLSCTVYSSNFLCYFCIRSKSKWSADLNDMLKIDLIISEWRARNFIVVVQFRHNCILLGKSRAHIHKLSS